MATRLVQISMQARDSEALGRFWAEAVGRDLAIRINLTSAPDPKTVKNRLHIDLASTSKTHQTELVTRLRSLGATPVDLGQGDAPWTFLADPEGNEFRLLAPA